MHAEFFTFFLFGSKVVVHPYHFFLLLAIIVVVGGSWIVLRRADYKKRDVGILLSATAVAALVGARVLNALINWSHFIHEPSLWLTFSAVGFSLYGGIISALIVGYFVTRILTMDPWKVLDRVIPLVGVGIALIRVGCYFRGCCFGKETNVVWGVHFPAFSPSHLHQISEGSSLLFGVHTVHPTQLYEIGGALLASIIAWILLKNKVTPGIPALTFIIIFTLVRFINYYFRVMPENYVTPVWFYPVVYSVILIITVSLLTKKVMFTKKGPAK